MCFKQRSTDYWRHTMAQITCSNVVLGYEGNEVVSELTFSVNCGDYLCIVGENGSGKSTLVKALLKLAQPISGSIIIGDGLKTSEIGYMPQQTLIQRDFPASVQEIVLSGFLNHTGFRPFYNKAERNLANTNMDKLGISYLAKHCYRELSGGQQQRVLLVRALCATQKILLLDEPVAGLDPKATQEMYDLVSKLNREENITIIMVSHDIAAAAYYASHVLHMDHIPKFFGTKAEYIKSDIGKAYLSVTGDTPHD